MVPAVESTETWLTIRWQCVCGRWSLWKAAPEALQRHGLDPLALSRGRITIRPGVPPATAFDVLRTPNFTCLCGARVPVVETLAALLQFGGPIVWEPPQAAAPAAPEARGPIR